MKKIDSSKLKYNVIIALLPVVTVFLLAPLEILAGNERDLKFGTEDYIWYFLLTAIVVVALITVFLYVLPKKVSGIFATIVFSIGLMAYVQNMFLNNDIANADGSLVEFSGLGIKNYINLFIWLLVIIVVIVAKIKIKSFEKIIFYIASFLIAIEMVAVFSILFTVKYKGELKDRYVIDASNQYKVASENNVILLILDKYGNGQFNSMIEEDFSYADCLKDFTYYNNMNSTYAYTDPSITYILTNYDVSDIANNRYVLDEAWVDDNTRSRFDSIHYAGYEIDLYSQDYDHLCMNPKYLNGILDNQLAVDCTIDYFMLYRLLLKTSIYKCMPYLLKAPFQVATFKYEGVIHYNAEPCKYYNIDYYNGLKEEGLTVDSDHKKKFIIEHFGGTHEPFSIDENANEIYLDSDEDYEVGVNKTKKGLMIVLDTYLNELKELGLYDSSTIIIMSDHGYKLDLCDAQPIFFIKEPNASHEKMQINSAPVSSEDVMPTLLMHMGIENDFQNGTTIYDWHEGDSRVRTCAYPENGYEPFTYDGDREDLIKNIKESLNN